MDGNKWESLLGQLDAGSAGGDVYYLKQPKTKVRLVLPQDGEGEVDEENFFAETTKSYQGKVSTAYLVFGVILQTSDKNDKNVDPKKVRAIRLPKTALRGIVAKLAEDYPLFDMDEGHSLVIERIGGGGSDRTSYDVTPSPKPFKVSDVVFPDKDIWTIAAEESVRSQERDDKKTKGEKPTRNVPKGVDSDEDLPF